MARRRVDNHFLVRYIVDNKLQVRNRQYFRDDSDIIVGKEYMVQWGRANEVDKAVVLNSGSDPQMRQHLREEQNGTCSPPPSPPSPPSPRSPRSPTPPRSPSASPSPPPKRKKVDNTRALVSGF